MVHIAANLTPLVQQDIRAMVSKSGTYVTD